MGSTGAFVVKKHQGVEITTNELNRFRHQFVEQSATHVNQMTYERSGSKNSRQHTVIVEFSGFVSADDFSKILGAVDHPFIVDRPRVSHPAPQGIHPR